MIVRRHIFDMHLSSACVFYSGDVIYFCLTFVSLLFSIFFHSVLQIWECMYYELKNVGINTILFGVLFL